ncbi:MAG: beta-glucosidase [Clostridia bacterium]|nr:beta-glucosidase [Clostridia bacterium]
MKFLRYQWKHLGTRIWMICSVLLIVLVIAAAAVAFKLPIAGNSLTLIFGGERANVVQDNRDEWYDRQYKSKAEVLEAAENFVVEVVEEGITLLKNEGGALPLSEGLKVSVFGKNSVNLVYGGSGSAGNVVSKRKTLYDSLDASKLSYNAEMKAFYEDDGRSGRGRPANPGMVSGQRLSGFAVGEAPVSNYDQKVRDSYREFGDVALVLISRIGGEGFDLPRTMAVDFTYMTPIAGASSPNDHYLELDRNEKDMIAEAKANFDKVIVILNVGTTMELDELAGDEGIDAIIWMGMPGSSGVMALGGILTGKTPDGRQISPSGRTVDTWAVDFTQDPSWYNSGVYGSEFGNRYLTGAGELSQFPFVNYEEGIYVGYRYWETRGFEENKIGEKDAWYSSSVVYPFGYGLSYTSFDWEVNYSLEGEVLNRDDTILVSVKVTNTGNWPGKDVAQLYYSAPYTPGGIEKAHVVLADFAKTGLLEPGQSETLTLSLKTGDMKSYDWSDANGNGFTGYEVEKGAYTIYAGRNAHSYAAEKTYTLVQNALLRKDINARGEETEITNQFDDVSAGFLGDWTAASFVSRRDFEGTLPKGYLVDARRTLTPQMEEILEQSIKRRYAGDDTGKPWQVDQSLMPSTTPVNNGISLQSMLENEEGVLVGEVSFDDPRWDRLLDQITLDEMKLLVGYGAFRSNPVAGIDGIVSKPMTTDADGPSGFTSFLSDSVIYDTCSYQAQCVLGATWNAELARRMGEMVGEEALVGDEKGDGIPYSGWYAPAVNIHRSPFAGRNWEYYSEDGLLSGRLAAAMIKAVDGKGVYTYVKHFAVNDQETDREYNGIMVWANEQSMRELYLKPFEIAVKEGGAKGMMTSFNRLGTVWAGGSYPLLTTVLRGEWGFRGGVVTDFSMNRYTYVDLMIRAGGDLFLTQDAKVFGMPDDATQVSLLRQAAKNLLYITANSNVMSVVVDGYRPPVWHSYIYALIALTAVLCAMWGVWINAAIRKKEKKLQEKAG